MSIERATRVLFLDDTNTGASQIAEALLRHHAAGAVEAYSAGLEPGAADPELTRVLRQKGVDARGLRVKTVSEFLARVPITIAVLLGRKDDPHAPHIYPFATETLVWECNEAEGDEADGEEAPRSRERSRSQAERLRDLVRRLEPMVVAFVRDLAARGQVPRLAAAGAMAV